MCPGSDFALSQLSINAASILQVFDIAAGVDEHGQRVTLSAEQNGHALS